MKKFQDYIVENEIVPIYEFIVTPVIFSLCAATALHFGVKLTKKIKKYANNFWNWACSDKNINMDISTPEFQNNDSDFLIKGEIKKIDKKNVQPMQIPSSDILKKLIENSNPKDDKQGLFVFQNLLKETPELEKINKSPYYPNYVIFMDPGSKDNEDEKPNFYGMLGFSQKYWSVVAKNEKDNKIKQFAANHKAYMNIFAVQTDPQYAKQGLFDVYFENMKKAVKETKMEGLTIKCENEDLAKVYSKYGFVKCKNLKGYMEMSLTKKK